MRAGSACDSVAPEMATPADGISLSRWRLKGLDKEIQLKIAIQAGARHHHWWIEGSSRRGGSARAGWRTRHAKYARGSEGPLANYVQRNVGDCYSPVSLTKELLNLDPVAAAQAVAKSGRGAVLSVSEPNL